MGGDGVRKLLLAYEIALARRDGRGIDRPLGELLADDFLEFGRSGRTWSASTIRELLASAVASDTSIEVVDFTVAALAPGVVLATYRSTPPEVNRSSIWIQRQGRWYLRFHQGTTRSQPAR